MSACPNKKSKEWEDLLEQVDGNEMEALYAYIKNGYEYPSHIDDVKESEEYEFNEDRSAELSSLMSVRNKIIHALNSKYELYKRSDNEKYIGELKELIIDFQNSELHIGFDNFITKALGNITMLEKKMEANRNDLQTLSTASNFAGTFELVNDLIPLLSNGTVEFTPETSAKARVLNERVVKFRDTYLKYSRSAMADKLALHSSYIEDKKRTEFGKEFEKENEGVKRDNAFQERKRSYINDKVEDAADEILELEKQRMKKKLLFSNFDIEAGTRMIIDPRGINEPMIQQLIRLLDSADRRVINEFTTNKKDLIGSWEGFVTGKDFNTTKAINAKEAVNNLKNNKDFIHLSDDQKKYINSKTGQEYDRVTSFISDEEVTESELLTTAGKIGTDIDTMMRDYFSGSFNEDDYDIIPDDVKATFIPQLEKLKKDFEDKGETVVADDILLFDDDLGVAGTVDILTYDKDGNFRIYDMKTMRQDHFKVNAYGNMIYDSDTAFDENNKPIKGKTKDSKRIKHSKQLSMYSHLLKSQTGKGAVELSILPIKVNYEAGDTVTTEADLREPVKLQHTSIKDKKLRIKAERSVSIDKVKGSGVDKRSLITDQKKLYEGIIEKIDDKETQYYVSEFYSTFYNERSEMFNELARLKELAADDKEKRLAKQKLLKKKVPVGKKEQAVYDHINKWAEKHLISLEKEKGRYDFSFENIKDEFKNPQFKELDNDPTRKAMYEQLIHFNKESDSLVPPSHKLGYKLPSSTQSRGEKITKGGVKEYIKDVYNDVTKFRVDDTQFGELETDDDGKVRVLTDQFGKALKRIAMPFRGKLDIKDQSYDLVGLALSNRFASLNYNEKNKILPDAQILSDLVGAREVGVKKGSKDVVRILKKQLGVSDEEIEEIRDTIKGTESETFKLMNGIIEDRLYGKSRIAASIPALDKVSDKLIELSAHYMLVANILGGTSNLINGKTMNLLEGAKGRYGVYSRKNLRSAEGLYWGDIAEITGDIGAIVPKSKTGLLNEKFIDTSMDFNGLSNKLISDSKLKRLASGTTLHAANSVGEHYIQSTLMYATLDNIKVKNKKGEYIGKDGTVVQTREEAVGMHYGYQLIDGEAIWNKAFTVEGHKEVTEDVEFKINRKVKDIIADLQGMYDKTNQSQIERYWFGKLGTFLRRWMVRGVQNRWRGVATVNRDISELDEDELFYSEAAGRTKEGSYTSLVRFIYLNNKKIRGFQGQLLRTDWNQLSDMEKGNIRKSAMEISIMVGSLIASSLLAGLAKANPDEEEKAALYTLAYLLKRQETELLVYTGLNPNEITRVMKTPTATMSFVEALFKLFNQLGEDVWNVGTGEDLELYQNGERKGKSKLAVQTLRMISPSYKNVYDKSAERSYKALDKGAY